MNSKTFKNLLNSYKDILNSISLLNDELDVLWYEATGVKGVRYDKTHISTPSTIVDDKRLRLLELINEKEAERDMYLAIVKVIENKLAKLPKEDKDIVMRILVENVTNEKVGREVGYTKSGIWYKVAQDIKKIL